MTLLGLKNQETDRRDPAQERFDSAVVSVEQMIAADRAAIKAGTAGFDLMLAAGQSVANKVEELYPHHHVLILCGAGNNGGDGYIAASLLAQAGRQVTVLATGRNWRLHGDAARARRHWGGKSGAFDPQALAALPDETVVVDAVFGTGFRGALAPPVTDIFAAVGQKKWPVIAVDVPSGVYGDRGEADPYTLQAQHSVTFFRKKMAHLFTPARSLCGYVSVHDIGIAPDIMTQTGATAFENDPCLWASLLPRPGQESHKYERGHVVVLGGAQMTGAGRMASESCMRTGAGLCTVAADADSAAIYKKGAPHIMVESLSGGVAGFAAHLSDARRNVAVLGPGAGLDDRRGLQKAVLETLATGKAVVLDADALSCFEGEAARLLDALHENCVLTPHEGEFTRLFPDLDGHKFDRAMAAAARAGAVILLKGAETIIARHDKMPVVNIHATPWLATAGAGDVLAGMIAGFAAQGVATFDAACAASWIHGESASRKGPGLVAPDIIEGIPSVLRDFA